MARRAPFPAVETSGDAQDDQDHLATHAATVSPRPFVRNYRPRRTAQYHSGRAAYRRDRLTAVAALAAAVAIVVIAGVSAARAHDHSSRSPLQGSRTTPSPSVTPKEAVPEHRRALAASPSVSPAPDPKRALAVALAPLLAHHTGDLAVGVIDRTTGERASTMASARFTRRASSRSTSSRRCCCGISRPGPCRAAARRSSPPR